MPLPWLNPGRESSRDEPRPCGRVEASSTSGLGPKCILASPCYRSHVGRPQWPRDITLGGGDGPRTALRAPPLGGPRSSPVRGISVCPRQLPIMDVVRSSGCRRSIAGRIPGKTGEKPRLRSPRGLHESAAWRRLGKRAACPGRRFAEMSPAHV